MILADISFFLDFFIIALIKLIFKIDLWYKLYYVLMSLVDGVGYANLGLLVNGRSANMTEFCAGEVLLFVCTIQTSIFQWNAGSLITGDTVSLGTDGAPGIEISGKFTLTAEGSGSNRRSTLQVTAFSDLSGVNIACRDPGNHDFVQTRTVTVYGK